MSFETARPASPRIEELRALPDFTNTGDYATPRPPPVMRPGLMTVHEHRARKAREQHSQWLIDITFHAMECQVCALAYDTGRLQYGMPLACRHLA